MIGFSVVVLLRISCIVQARELGELKAQSGA